MEATYSSRMSVDFKGTAQCYILEDRTLSVTLIWMFSNLSVSVKLWKELKHVGLKKSSVEYQYFSELDGQSFDIFSHM
jgi:hypothetical protein